MPFRLINLHMISYDWKSREKMHLFIVLVSGAQRESCDGLGEYLKKGLFWYNSEQYPSREGGEGPSLPSSVRLRLFGFF